jgi:uncharacterized protein YcbK (DUF882 family)
MKALVFLVPACLALSACVVDQSGNLDLKLSSDEQAISSNASGLAAHASADQPQLVTFIAPSNPPLPVPRPDFGDRPAHVADAKSNGAAQAELEPEKDQLADASETSTQVQSAALDKPEQSPASWGFFSSLSMALTGKGEPTLLAYQDAEIAEEDIEDDRPLEPGPKEEGQHWRAAYANVSTDCFPAELKTALNKIGEHFKSDVLVTSGFRGNGRRGSLHRSCRAADIRVLGVAPSRLAAFARTVEGVNGVGTYRRTSVTHVDVRHDKYAWRY